MSIRRVFIMIVPILITIALYLTWSNHNPILIQKDVTTKLETKALDKLLAEDLSLSTQLFLKQLVVQLEQWANTDLSNQEMRRQFNEQLKAHDHIRAFALLENGQARETIGSFSDFDLTKLTHTYMDETFSSPYEVNEKQYMLISKKINEHEQVVSEIDLSFIQSFIKDTASIADSTGAFFISNSDPTLEWGSVQDLPEDIYTHTVPNLGWQIAIHSDDDNEQVRKQHYDPHQVVIKLKRNKDINEWIKEHSDLTLIDQHGPLYVIESEHETSEQLITRLQKERSLQFVEPNYMISNQLAKGSIQPNDEFFQSFQWNLKEIEVEKGWNLANGEDVIIAIIDTGVDANHEDLKNKIHTGFDAISDTDDFYDEHGHGTHVAGIASAVTNNLTGIAGVSWNSTILPVKVLNKAGEGTSYEVAKGIYWAVDNGASVINMSLGDYHDTNVLYDAIKYAYDHDVVLIAASGNDNVEEPMYPAKYDEVLAVGAIDESKNRAFFSNYGQHVDVTAPGEHIPSLYIDNSYIIMSGTSMASPHVAGLAALIRSVNPQLSNKEVYTLIKRTADDLGTRGHDPYYGFGEININQALKELFPKNNETQKVSRS